MCINILRRSCVLNHINYYFFIASSDTGASRVNDPGLKAEACGAICEPGVDQGKKAKACYVGLK